MTWNEINEKYPEDRGDMSPEELEHFIEDCYVAYESEGFAPQFWTPYEQYQDRIGSKFRVIGRVGTNENDIEVLPMWRIEFADGIITLAFPEEIILSEMLANGYRR